MLSKAVRKQIQWNGVFSQSSIYTTAVLNCKHCLQTSKRGFSSHGGSSDKSIQVTRQNVTHGFTLFLVNS